MEVRIRKTRPVATLVGTITNFIREPFVIGNQSLISLMGKRDTNPIVSQPNSMGEIRTRTLTHLKQGPSIVEKTTMVIMSLGE